MNMNQNRVRGLFFVGAAILMAVTYARCGRVQRAWFPTRTWDAGLVDEGDTVRAKFAFANVTDTVAKINGWRLSCACEKAQIRLATVCYDLSAAHGARFVGRNLIDGTRVDGESIGVGPGDSGEVLLEVSSRGRSGGLRGKLWIYSDFAEDPEV